MVFIPPQLPTEEKERLLKDYERQLNERERQLLDEKRRLLDREERLRTAEIALVTAAELVAAQREEEAEAARYGRRVREEETRRREAEERHRMEEEERLNAELERRRRDESVEQDGGGTAEPGGAPSTAVPQQINAPPQRRKRARPAATEPQPSANPGGARGKGRPPRAGFSEADEARLQDLIAKKALLKERLAVATAVLEAREKNKEPPAVEDVPIAELEPRLAFEHDGLLPLAVMTLEQLKKKRKHLATLHDNKRKGVTDWTAKKDAALGQ